MASAARELQWSEDMAYYYIGTAMRRLKVGTHHQVIVIALAYDLLDFDLAWYKLAIDKRSETFTEDAK